ncbi:hypothetical protein [Paraburkholderia tagetis]|uniref:Uncharacterized protein n=1 Tax=Paraburkholderia tagetis TaxID=2913261 RepID=A0A9X1RK95_9BURK|nr:hypothetical protein [Paraburkholderia tagetis]MCG5072883.1 hypothetical protein [Paraburkholderia tagetis]
MCLLVWKGSLEKPLLRDVLAGANADMAGPERAPVIPGVAFFEVAASAVRADAAFFMLVPEVTAGVAFACAVPVRGAVRPLSFAAPAAPRGLAALARGDLVSAFPAGARGAT